MTYEWLWSSQLLLLSLLLPPSKGAKQRLKFEDSSWRGFPTPQHSRYTCVWLGSYDIAS